MRRIPVKYVMPPNEVSPVWLSILACNSVIQQPMMWSTMGMFSGQALFNHSTMNEQLKLRYSNLLCILEDSKLLCTALSCNMQLVFRGGCIRLVLLLNFLYILR